MEVLLDVSSVKVSEDCNSGKIAVDTKSQPPRICREKRKLPAEKQISLTSIPGSKQRKKAISESKKPQTKQKPSKVQTRNKAATKSQDNQNPEIPNTKTIRSKSAPPTGRDGTTRPEESKRDIPAKSAEETSQSSPWPYKVTNPGNRLHVGLVVLESHARDCSKTIVKDYFSKFRFGVTPQARSVATQWMVYLQRKLPSPLSPFTLHLAISIFDRFYSKICTSKVESDRDKAASNIDVAAAACIFIASKMEDVWPVDLRDVRTLGTSGLSGSCVLEWEKRILVELDFEVNQPTVLDFFFFLPTFQSQLQSQKDAFAEMAKKWSPKYSEARGKTAIQACSEYFAEVILMHHESIGVPAHMLARAVLASVLSILRKCPINEVEVDKVEDEDQTQAVLELASKLLCVFLLHEKANPNEKGGGFARDVDAKHKDACPFLLAATKEWKQMDTNCL
eukprot:GHVP01061765.1.p1 GENE.GHVP01061765.1~~GHVP01061765.1.p1  ORF type:complete len:450 (+),score=81.04 GHVP01061765.1:81-1430(+)